MAALATFSGGETGEAMEKMARLAVLMARREEGFENDPRVIAKAKELGEYLDLDAALQALAIFLVGSDEDHEASTLMVQIATRMAVMAHDADTRNEQVQAAASKRGKVAADALHGRPGSSRYKQEQIRALWASGKYTSRDVCAEQECAALNMSFSTARKALRNTPEPPGRCNA